MKRICPSSSVGQSLEGVVSGVDHRGDLLHNG